MIKMHADAKRYLCTVDKNYWNNLSQTSQTTMMAQGGLMNEKELADFTSCGPVMLQDAILLRRSDEQGKKVNHIVPDTDHFRGCIERVVAMRKVNL